MRKCYDCPHFKIDYDPLISGGVCWDFGRASCKKHNLVVEFRSERKLKKLECIEGTEQGVSHDGQIQSQQESL